MEHIVSFTSSQKQEQGAQCGTEFHLNLVKSRNSEHSVELSSIYLKSEVVTVAFLANDITTELDTITFESVNPLIH